MKGLKAISLEISSVQLNEKYPRSLGNTGTHGTYSERIFVKNMWQNKNGTYSPFIMILLSSSFKGLSTATLELPVFSSTTPILNLGSRGGDGLRELLTLFALLIQEWRNLQDMLSMIFCTFKD